MSALGKDFHYRNPGLCRVLGALLSTFCRALDGAFVECRTRQSPALGNDSVCREQDSRHRNTLGKDFFAECQTLGEGRLSVKGRQSPSKATVVTFAESRVLALGKESSLPSAPRLTLGRASCAECLPWVLGKVYFYFFYFANQTFCSMFLHYVDLHVPFWNNYKSVFYNYWI
jgi:hypothetical protein